MSERDLDVVVYGATGFTGRLVAEYLLERYGADGELRWAMAGRSAEKLEKIRAEIGEVTGSASGAIPLVVADASDETALDAMVRSTKVVATTVGPYALYGDALVAACAREGTDYCDLTGEAQWMRRVIDAHQDAAVESGARLVPTCGFDCIPADVGVHFVQREVEARAGSPSREVKMRVAGFSGGASGGTIASMLQMMEEAGRDPEVMRIMQHPYALNPKGERSGPDDGGLTGWAWDADFEQWIAPFVMGPIDTKVVRRSNALQEYRYGRDFRYDEAVLSGEGAGGWLKAAGTSIGSGAGMAAMAIGPVRRLVSGRLPSPGEGPSREVREAGYFDLRFHAAHPGLPGGALRARVRGDRDPGYGSTSKMLGESAVCLAKDALPVAGGFWTPASAMGDALLTRLPERAGVSFEVETD